MKKTVYFISDIHLGLEAKEKENLKEDILIKFLNGIHGGKNELYIVGDLFDYWFEYRRVIQKGYFKLFTSLKNAVDSGTKIYYLIGNHDFLHRDFFEKELGVTIIQNEIAVEKEDKKFFIAHGDGLMKGDYGYKFLKRVLRNKFLQWVFSLIHPDLGIYLASSSSKTSRNYTTNKNYGEMNGLFETAKSKIEAGFEYVVFGHSHQFSNEKYLNGNYINLGSWLEKPRCGKFQDGKFEIMDLGN